MQTYTDQSGLLPTKVGHIVVGSLGRCWHEKESAGSRSSSQPFIFFNFFFEVESEYQTPQLHPRATAVHSLAPTKYCILYSNRAG